MAVVEAPAPAGQAVYDPDTLCWLAAGSLDGTSLGDAIVAGSKVAHTLPSGRALCVECCYGHDREQFLLDLVDGTSGAHRSPWTA